MSLPINKKLKIKLLIDGGQTFKAIHQCIIRAKKTIRIRMFMWRNDGMGRKILELLSEKIRRSPSISIIIEKDLFGSRVYNLDYWFSFGKKGADIFSERVGKNFLKTQRRNVHFIPIGSKSLLMFKLRQESDHSKVYVFDEETPRAIAIIGGMNIGDEYLTPPNFRNPDRGGWHDYMIYLQGKLAGGLLPSVTLKNKQWLTMKLEHGAELLFNMKERRKMKHYILGEIKKAKKSILLEHAYLTDESIVRHLRKAVTKGVRVTMVVPDRSDGVFHANMHSLRMLLKPFRSGNHVMKTPKLQIYLYPGMIHAKVIIVDRATTIVGSANLTAGSFDQLNETMAVVRQKDGITKELLRQIQKDMKRSRKLSYQTVPHYNLLRAKIEKIFI